MKLWLISQTENNWYDTYDSAVVASETEEAARLIYPNDNQRHWSGSRWLYHKEDGTVLDFDIGGTWTSPDNVHVQFLADGYEGEAGTVLASFNAG